MSKAIVIGAGFGGIAAALRLRAKGYDVTLIDKQDKLGGRGYQYVRNTPLGTFVHDAGPTVVTAKFLFDELFELFGKKREDYIEFRDIFPWYRIVFAGAGKGQEASGKSEGDSSSSLAPCPLPLAYPHFDYGGTIEQMEAQIRTFGGDEDVDGFRRYLKHSKKIFDVGFTDLGAVPFHKFGTMLKCAPDLLRLQNYKTVWGMAKKYIKNDSLRRVFSFQPLLVGGNPFNTTSIYSLIFYLEREWGVQFAMGGTGAIVRGLEKLMREEGVNVRLGEEVELIQCTGRYDGVHGEDGVHEVPGCTSAVRLKSGETIHLRPHVEDPKIGTVYYRPGHSHFDVGVSSSEVVPVSGGRGFPFADDKPNPVVVCNADAPMVYSKLLDRKYRKGVAARRIDSKVAPQKYSMGLFVMYFGTKRTYPDVAHHTIVLGKQYKELIDDLFDRFGLEGDDTSVYLHRPTATDPSMAPAGCESFYVLVPVPNNQPLKSKQRRRRSDNGAGMDVALRPDGSIDWSVMGPRFRDATVKYLERTILPNLSETIVDDFYVTPDHFEKNLNSMHGAGFSIQPIFSQSAWFRFHNKAPGIEGLYFVGAGTHPGAGMPGVLCSAKVLEHLIPSVK
jgi:phytoene desaturase